MECLSSVWSQNSLSQLCRLWLHVGYFESGIACWWSLLCGNSGRKSLPSAQEGTERWLTTQLILSTWRTIRSEVTDCPNSSLYCRTVVLIHMKSDCVADIQNLNRITRLYKQFTACNVNQIVLMRLYYRNIWNSRILLICLVIMMISVSLVRSYLKTKFKISCFCKTALDVNEIMLLVLKVIVPVIIEIWHVFMLRCFLMAHFHSIIYPNVYVLPLKTQYSILPQ